MTALTRLCLTDFRNHIALDINLDTRPVCLYGVNGAGKTNVLEAISQLSPGRGLRAANLTDLTRRNASAGWTVSARLDNDQKIGVGLEKKGSSTKRIVRLNGAPTTATDLSELIPIIWLTPAMDGVFRGGASERRRFFDRQVMAHIPSHGSVSKRYEKAMRERNALLEQNPVDSTWADAIEARMAEAGAIIATNRTHILKDLQMAVNARPEGHFPKSDLALEGEAEIAAVQGAGLIELENILRERLARNRFRDQVAKRALSGPHRSDLIVIHRQTGAPARNASTGQQKALLTGLILANAHAFRKTGPKPLILLDEATAHLDENRRAALFDELISTGCQAWLTGTENSLFAAFGERAQRLEVNGE